MKSFIYFLATVGLALLLRYATALYGYSGAGKPPMFGDYEAQRHWMEITTNLPIQEWYVNSTQNDLMYWGLDYPPLTAYHSWLLGKISEMINPEWVELFQSRGFESADHKQFMRYSVISSDFLIYFTGIIALCMWSYKGKSTQYKMLTAGLMLCYPGLILIDHGHFQFNSISLGLMVWGVAFLMKEHELFASVAFSLALNYKQMELYHALPFFIYMLSNCFSGKGNWFVRLATIGATVIFTFSAVWFPFLNNPDSALQVVSRVFPVARGVFEDKVASFWCSLNVFYKIKEIWSSTQIVTMCTITTVLANIPIAVGLFLEPSIRNFKLALINSSLAFFLFSFHVHEKTILLVAVPVCMMIPDKPLSSLWFLTISTFSMLPLLQKDGLMIPYVGLSCIFFLLCGLAVKYLYTSPVVFPSNPDTATLNEIRKDKERRDREGWMDALTHALFWLSMFGAFVLTVLSVFAPPPAALPHLWPVLVSLYSCGHYALFLAYYLYQQLLVDEHPHTHHHHHQKQEHIKGKSRTFSNKHRKKNQ